MCEQLVTIFTCGILKFPGESENFTGKAVTWFLKRLKLAEKIEYLSGPLFSRSMLQKRRERKLVKTITHFQEAEFKINLVAHSNGADVVRDALETLNWPRIEAIHLFSPACEADFNKNGFNSLNVGKFVVYIAGKDIPIKWAENPIGEFFGFGHDILGKKGPINNKIPVEIIIEPTFGHSDWFADSRFDQTMLGIIN